ncbi:MAG TPA: DNA translocase FtsK 4TM domain-containing protein, partial [Vicinamibacterales bacterium]|nr:DNA translocase FtsK 4TM domain-containing protein [Vicinamibacterales bacterium]
MGGSALSRRLSELAGVVCFGAALVWLVALASYTPTDPVWFFNAGVAGAPANLAGRVGAFLAELSFQLLGYAAYLLPAALAVLGWQYFWCVRVEAPYSKLVGTALVFGCVAAFLSLALDALAPGARAFRAGGYAGEWLAAALTAYFNRTGAIILILTLLCLGVVLATHFSLGRAAAAAARLLQD